MAERSMKARLGAFVVMAMVTLTALVILFGGSPKFFSTRTSYFVYFSEAPGISPGTPVRKSGVRIGQVSALDIEEESGRVKLTIEIEGKHQPRQNEEPVIARGLLSGDTTLDFVPKVDKDGTKLIRTEAYAANAEIVGVPPLNTNRLLSTASETVPNANDALMTFTSTVGAFKSVGPKAEKTLDEIQEFMKSARAILPELRETNKRVQDFIGSSDVPAGGNGQQIALNNRQAAGDGNLKALTKDVQDFLKVLKPLVEDLRSLVKDNQGELTKTLKGLSTLTERANEVLSDDNRKAIVNTLQTLQTAAGEVLSKENRDSINLIIKNVREGSDDLSKALKMSSQLVVKADNAMKDLSEAMKTANVTVKNFNDRVTQVKIILDDVAKLSKPLAEVAEPTLKNISRAADELATTIIESRKIIAMLGKPEGTFGKLTNDPALYNQLVDATTNLNRTLIRAEKIAKDLEIFADKVARKPESIGIGGALRPSIGLKESPYAPVPTSTPFPVPSPGSGNSGTLRPLPPTHGGVGLGEPILGPIVPGDSEKMTPIAPIREGQR
jgi:phospholipid/cholesterol/gamma-HCH transport system substrate-binding protein